MNNIIQFPISPVHSFIKRKTFVVNNYNAACILFDKWHTDYCITGTKFSKMMTASYLNAMDKLGAELDAMGGAL